MEKWVTALLLLVGVAGKWVTTEEIASLCTSESSVFCLGEMGHGVVVARRRRWEMGHDGGDRTAVHVRDVRCSALLMVLKR